MESIRHTVLRCTRRVVRPVAARFATWLVARSGSWRAPEQEAGMTTAELLGNAALGIAALVAIWAVMQTLGLDVVDWIRGQLRV
jgi:hypothetical protein